MKILSVVVLVLLLSASFCAGPKSNEQPKLVIVNVDYSKGDTTNFQTSKAEVRTDDTLMFKANKIMKTTTVLVPMGDLIFKLKKGEAQYEEGDINFMFVPLQRDRNEWTSRKYIINKHNKHTEYDYSVYIHKNKKMAEAESSPKIIVDP